MSHEYDMVIIGGGLAGLRAALELEQFDLRVLIVEKEDRVGGRIKTDEWEGFKLDRGFQVYLDAYPEGKSVLHYKDLNLRNYDAGALCFDRQQKFTVSDTTRNKWAYPRMAFSPVGSLMDKIRLGNLTARLKRISLEEIFERPELSTAEYLKQQNFSDRLIKRFFQPFFAGVFLEPELSTSSRMFEFVFKMMSEGNVCLPAEGMEAIPRQLKAKLRRTEFRFHTEVKEIQGQEIILANQENIRSKHIIIAAEPSELVPQMAGATEWRQTATYYFSAPKSPLRSRLLALNYQPKRLVNNFSVLSDISAHYAPVNQHLISVSLSEIPDLSVEEVSQKIKNELSASFGTQVQSWQFLKNYHLRKALPKIREMRHQVSISETRIREGLYLAGDQFLNPSIDAALRSGKLAAQEAVLQFKTPS